jgi:hypothetical protein
MIHEAMTKEKGNPKMVSLIKDARHPARNMPLELAALILHQLYYIYPRDEFFRHKRAGFTSFLTHCIDNAPKEITPAQKALGSLLGEANEAHLYIPQWDAETPTHYISIVKDADTGLWRLRHPKIRAIGSRLSYGVLVSWKAVTPVPEVAIDITPVFHALVRGKTAFDSLINVLIDSPHPVLLEEAMQCMLLSRMFGQSSKGRVAIWVPSDRKKIAGARISFAQQIDRLSDPKVRKSVPYPERFHIRTTDQPLESLCPAPFSIVPVIPGYEPEDFLGSQDMLLDKILKSRLMPFVGHQREDNRIDVYALAYSPLTQTAAPVKIFKDRLPRNCTDIPYFRAWPKYQSQNVWIPNEVLAAYMRRLIINTTNSWFFTEALSTMPFFGAIQIESYNSKVFARYGMEISAEQIAAIVAADQQTQIQEQDTADDQ